MHTKVVPTIDGLFYSLIFDHLSFDNATAS